VQIHEDWGHKVCGLLLGYVQHVLIDSVLLQLHIGLLYNCQPFHYPTSVECLAIDCKVDCINANLKIMPESHNIWVQYTECVLDNSFQGKVCSFPVVCFSWTPPNKVLRFQKYLLARRTIPTFSMCCTKTHQWILCPEAQEYAVVIPTKYKHRRGWADCVVRLLQILKQTKEIHIVCFGAMVALVHCVWENATSAIINSVWLVNNHVYFNSYWTVCKLEYLNQGMMQ